MSENVERIYTINLGKVLLSPNNRRSKRAINMIKEFATHHMKTEQIRIDQDLSHKIWEKGIRHPPRKIRVKMNRLEDDYILISPYDENADDNIPATQTSKDTALKNTPSVSDVKDTTVIKAEPDTDSAPSESNIDVKAPKVEQETKEKQNTSPKLKETSKQTISSESKPNDKTKSKPKSNTKTDSAKQSQSSKSTDKK